jgi:hypothetical protein
LPGLVEGLDIALRESGELLLSAGLRLVIGVEPFAQGGRHPRLTDMHDLAVGQPSGAGDDLAPQVLEDVDVLAVPTASIEDV